MTRTESPVSERINILLEKLAGGNKAELGRAAGISGQAIADLVGGKKGGPSFPVLQKLLRSYPQVNERWLIFGEGEMLKSEPTQSQSQEFLSYRAGKPVSKRPTVFVSSKSEDMHIEHIRPKHQIDVMMRVLNDDGTESIIWVEFKEFQKLLEEKKKEKSS